MPEKTWSDEEIKTMWPQAAGELKGFQHALEAKSGLTASQLGMALQLAEISFAELKKDKPEQSTDGVPANILDEIEALFDHVIAQFLTTQRMPDLLSRFGQFDRWWSILKHSREKAGRPKPTLR